jgi:hypothetical protein
LNNRIQAERLIKKFNVYKGMISEILMKCKLLKFKVQSARRASVTSDSALEELIRNSLAKYKIDLYKYKKKMLKIYRQVEELCR